jgi:hypothetical protein
MKKTFVLFSLIFLMAQVSWAATYNSSGSTAPNLSGSWSPIPSNFTTAGDIFIIQAGHTMTTTANWAVSGTVQINGTLVASNTVTIGTLTVNSSGTYQHNISGGTVPTATWASGSTLYVTGVTTAMPSGIVGSTGLSNLTWNCTGQTSTSAALTGTLTVGGDLTIQSTGSYQFRVQTSPITVNGNVNILGPGTMYVAGQAAKVMNVGGDVNVSGGTLDISSGSSNTYQGILIVAGNFSITGTGVVTESGSTTNAVIVFKGSSLQTVTNSGTLSGSLSFSFDNTSGFSLNSDLSIALADSMRNGNIALNGHTLTLGTATSSTGTLVWTSGFLTGSGTFKRWFGTSGLPTTFIDAGRFPMGSGTNNRSVIFDFSSATGLSTGGTISVSHTDATGSTSVTSFTDGALTVVYESNMNWGVTQSGLVLGTGTISAQITGGGIGGVTAVTDLALTRGTSIAGGTRATSGGTTSVPLVSRTGMTVANITAMTFYIGANINSPLPIELTSFTGSVKAGIVTLNWATATEVNNFCFNVERLSSNKTWQNIGFVQGAGLSNSVKKYSFIDNSAKAGSYSYRLQQVDNNGAYTYSPVIEVNNNAQPTSFSIGNYPNPFNPSTTIRYALPANSFVNITICNILGQKIVTLVNQNMEQGLHEVSFNASSFASGTYIYKIEAGSFSATHKMLLMK